MENRGKFFLVGGGPAVRSLGEPLMGHFINEAGNNDAHIMIITAGTNDPSDVNACYWEIFESWGVKKLFSPKIFSREDAQADWLYKRIIECSGVFIAGGSQYKLSQRLNNTPVEEGIRKVLEGGGVVGGTSSGASIFAGPMILSGGNNDAHLRRDMVELGAGFAMLGEDILIDTHCASRGRLPRIISFLTEQPNVLSIGLDEDTALLIDREGNTKILGSNAAYFLDGSQMTLTHKKLPNDEHLCASKITLHALTSGDEFSLKERKPLIKEIINN
ncbi:MAG: cyanophycinase [Acidobacteria bacterium]|nr:cyanophycinase [Acidobacteriota bacterium]